MIKTHTFATNMTCGNCLAKVRPLLDGEPNIASWSANLDDPRKTITVDLADNATSERVVHLIGQAGFEANLVETAEPTSTASQVETVSMGVPQAKPSFKLSTYQPLLIVVGYVLGLTVLFEWTLGSFEPMRAMSYFMGFFFLGFAFFKLLDVSKFADAFASYDIVAKRSRAYALAYPFLELGLGLLFVTRVALPVANIVTAIVMSVGLIGVVSAVRKKQVIQCACLGTAFNLPMSVVTIIENSVMIVMAISMLVLNVLR